ncbi:MGMT family protein [Agaribacter marinus]|uniref:Methylated-DNA--protein-cysteine methyltransferase n=1 Tax=Agaribacter marinus TaxID=1431249 RepID=A0AA37WKH3_9ALTE|nr:MGMT family protein [Agaribacter marinus]GLR70970.1 methylated-DNA--protein-cysteine methyltransferase [Agaribacter marinus]
MKMSSDSVSEGKNATDKHGAIWHVVNMIPPGSVASYGQVADLAGLPGRARLVGKCLGNIPDGMQVAWHRVLRSNGYLAFPVNSEQALRQTALLQEENVAVFNNKVKMRDFQWEPDLYTLLYDLEK